MPRGSLLECVQDLLERTYRMRSGVEEVGRFVIGDAGYRRLYRDAAISAVRNVGSGAKTLVRETAEGVRASVYYPDAMIRCLEAHPPQRGLRDENVDAFAVLVEELDHLLLIAERTRAGRTLTLFELELHANVSKHLVLARFLAGAGRPLDERRRIWLRYHLFHKGTVAEPDPESRARYQDAARWGLRFLDGIARQRVPVRLETVRRFHAGTSDDKLEIIRRLAA